LTYALPEYGYVARPVAPFYRYGGTWDHDGGHKDFGHGDRGHDFGHARR
jgi:hypothetical protein